MGRWVGPYKADKADLIDSILEMQYDDPENVVDSALFFDEGFAFIARRSEPISQKIGSVLYFDISDSLKVEIYGVILHFEFHPPNPDGPEGVPWLSVKAVSEDMGPFAIPHGPAAARVLDKLTNGQYANHEWRELVRNAT